MPSSLGGAGAILAIPILIALIVIPILFVINLGIILLALLGVLIFLFRKSSYFNSFNEKSLKFVGIISIVFLIVSSIVFVAISGVYYWAVNYWTGEEMSKVIGFPIGCDGLPRVTSSGFELQNICFTQRAINEDNSTICDNSWYFDASHNYTTCIAEYVKEIQGKSKEELLSLCPSDNALCFANVAEKFNDSQVCKNMGYDSPYYWFCERVFMKNMTEDNAISYCYELVEKASSFRPELEGTYLRDCFRQIAILHPRGKVCEEAKKYPATNKLVC